MKKAYYKKILLTLAIWLVTQSLANAQIQCNSQYFTTQADVNAFANTGCNIVDGSVIITGAGITDLSPLSSITRINGTLSISQCNALSSLQGLNNVSQVDAIYFNDNDNTNFKNLQGLNGLTTIKNSLFVWKNDYLESFAGLDNLRDTLQWIKIVENIRLTDLSALSHITTVTGDPNKADGGGFTVKKNKLSSLAGLDSLTYVGTFFSLQHEDHLTDITALGKLSQITGQFAIQFNDSLTTLDGLERVISIGDQATVSNNSQLTDCEALCPFVLAGGAVIIGSNGGGNCDANFGTYCNSILPVVLSSFTVTAAGQTTQLHWRTESEENARGFTIQRSTDGVHWIDLDFTPAQGGVNSAYEYEWTDYRPKAGVDYYRLKLLDRDDFYTYSMIRTVLFDVPETALTVRPNPARDAVFLSTAGPAHFRVFDDIGRLMWTGTDNKVDVSSWPKGWYIVIATAGGHRMHSRFLVY